MKDKRGVGESIGINGGGGPAWVKSGLGPCRGAREPGDTGLPRSSTARSPASPQAALTHTPSPYSFPPPHPTHCPDFTGAFVPALRPPVGLPLCSEEKGPLSRLPAVTQQLPKNSKHARLSDPCRGVPWGLPSDPSPIPQTGRPPCDLAATLPLRDSA